MTILDDRAAKAIQEAMDARVRALSANHPTTHMAEVIEVDQDGITWVHVFGGADRTPAIRSLAKVKKGDLVTVTIEEGVVTINGSSSNPAATVEYVEAANYAVAEYAKQAIAGVLGDVLQVKNAIIEKATIEDLTAVEATVQTLTASYANLNEIVAGKANIVDLTAATGRISQLEADDVTINGKITAAEGRIGTIESDYLKTTDMDAEVARVGTLLTGYAEADLANVNNAWISNGIIDKAAIFDANVFDITGQTATISEINAANINVTNLHTSNLTVDTADGYVTIGNKKTPTKEFLDSLKNELQQEIDGAVETFTVDHVPLMLNAPATDWELNPSDYDTQQEYEEAQRRAYAKHVGDIAYVTNPAVDQNGYCYRFTYDSTLQEFKWVLIKDSDVTKALSDISDLQTFESETSTWINETDQGLETIRTNHTTLSGVVDKTVKKSVQLWYTKANTTAPDPPTSQVTSTSTSGNGWRVVVPAWNASYPNYYYCWQYELADGTFSWSPVVRDIAMGESQGTSRSAQTTANANIKSNVQLWFTKANNTSPDKPTTVVTTNNAGTANAWNIAVPTYNSSYPHYFYCYQQQKGDGTYQWTDVVYDKGTTESMEKAQAALPISSFNTFQQTTFKDVKDTVDEQSSTITQMQSDISDKADGSTVSALSTTVNSVSQTATANSSVISQLATTLGTNADGTTKAGDVVQRMSAAEQDLSGFKTTVSNTYATNNDLNTTNGNVAAAQADATSALNRQVAYSGTSSTGATTAAKVVTCANFPALAAGVTITVRFSVANTSAGALTLNVNSTGAKTIYVSGAATAAANQLIWAANANISFTYDGTYWRVDSEPRTWFGTCSTAEGTARKDSTVNEVVFCKGTTVALNMTNANTSTSATLNLLGSSLTEGAKNLYYGTSTTRPTTENGYGWGAASTAVFVFDGQYWRVGDTSTMSRLNAAETTITNHTTSIQQNATDITSKASQTEVDTLTGRVSSAESSITQTATSITSLVANNDTYTAPDGTTKTNTIKSAIKQNADAIDLRVEKSGVIAAINASVEQEGGSAVKISADKVNVEGATIFTSGRLSQTSLNNAYDAKGAAAAVQTNLDNMEVGGRNLLLGTAESKTKNVTSVNSSNFVVFDYYNLNVPYNQIVVVDDLITVSFDWSCTATTGSFHLELGASAPYTWGTVVSSTGTRNSASNYVDVTSSNQAGHVSITFKATSAHVSAADTLISFRIRCDSAEWVGKSISISKAKAERGNVATDWTPAPEDHTAYVDESIDGISIGGRNLLRNTANPPIVTPANYEGWNVSSGGNGVGTVETVSDSPVANATKSLRISNNASGNRDFGQRVATIESDLSATYRLSFWVRGIGGNVSALIRSWNNTSGKVAFSKTLSVGTEWTYFEFDFDPDSLNSPASGDLCDVRLGITGAGSIEYIAPKLERGNVATDWTPAPEDIKADAIAQEQYIYISKGVGTTSVSKNETWVSDVSGNQNTWTAKRPQYSSSYPVLFVARQSQTVAQKAAGTTCTCTTPHIDDTTTIIDGGNIITGDISAARIKANVINAVNNGTGTINADKINASQLSIGQSQVTDLTTDLTAKASASDLTAEINQRKAQYGTCSTGAGTQAKVVTCANFELVAGNELTVKFSTANTYASGAVQLNVNSKGAKNVWVANAVTSTANKLLWGAGAYITFRYDGTQFIVIGEPREWYGASTTGASTTAKTDTTAVTGCVICKGTKVSLAMSNENTASAPTLNIQSTGALAIYAGNSTTRPTSANGLSWSSGYTQMFIFDGTQWRTGDSGSTARAKAQSDAAAKTATNYITATASEGIKVHNASNTTTYVQILNDAIDFVHNSASAMKLWLDNSIAKIRVGLEAAGHAIFSATGMDVYISSSSKVASIGETSTIGADDNVQLKIAPGAMSLENELDETVYSVSVEAANSIQKDVTVVEFATPDTTARTVSDPHVVSYKYVGVAVKSMGDMYLDPEDFTATVSAGSGITVALTQHCVDWLNEEIVPDLKGNEKIEVYVIYNVVDVKKAALEMEGMASINGQDRVLNLTNNSWTDSNRTGAYLSVNNTSAGREVIFGVGESGNNVGIWDVDNKRWMIYSNDSGVTGINGKNVTVSAAGNLWLEGDRDTNIYQTSSKCSTRLNATAPSSQMFFGGLIARDLNKDMVFYSESSLTTSGSLVRSFVSRRYSANGATAYNNGFYLHIDSSGNPSVSFTTGGAAAWRNGLGLGNTTGALPIANGGTGQTSANAAARALGLAKTKGDSFTVYNINAVGFLSNARKTASVTVYFPYLVYGTTNATSCTLTGSFYARQNNGYCFGTTASATASLSSFTVAINRVQSGYVTFNVTGGEQTLAINNDPISLYFSSLTIKLT